MSVPRRAPARLGWKAYLADSPLSSRGHYCSEVGATSRNVERLASKRKPPPSPMPTVLLARMWGEREPKARGPRPGLTLEVILDAAIAVADREGLAALSMQRLSRELGFSTMALYRYVEKKDDLLDLMLDRVMKTPPAERTATWRKALEHWALAEWRLLRRHPWALELVANRGLIGPNRMAWLDAAYTSMGPAGLTVEEVLLTVISIDRYVRGAARDTLTPTDERPAAEVWWAAHAPFVEARFPTLGSALGKVAARLGDPPDAELSHGLSLLLDGIEALIAKRQTKKRTRERA